MAAPARRRDRRGSRPRPTPVEPGEVVVARFEGSVEAEVARAMLEGAGISCRLHPVANSQELYVTGEDLPVAQAVLQPDRTPPVTMSSAAKCTLCGARDSRWQGWIFWTLLVAALVALIPVGLWLSHGVLLMAASGAALVLAGVELSFKDYRCNRCGKHFRLQSQRRRAR